MKRLILLCLITSLCVSCNYSDAQSALDSKNILIVYLSRTKNTKTIAEIIQSNLGGKLIELELQTPYPKDYETTVQQVLDENTSGYLPPLKTKIDSIEKYDLVFIGFPTWGMKLPPPIKSFLKLYNLSGKTVVPFNTNAGYGVGTSFETVKELCTKSTVLEGFEMKGGVERDGVLLTIKGEKKKEAEAAIERWLQKLTLLANSL